MSGWSVSIDLQSAPPFITRYNAPRWRFNDRTFCKDWLSYIQVSRWIVCILCYVYCRSHLENVGVWVVMSKNHHPFSKSTKIWNILLYNQRLPLSTIWQLEWSHIFSRSGVVDPDPHGSRFGSGWAKFTHKTRKKWKYVLFCGAGCSL